MAEIVGIIGSAIAVANSAGALSRALFDIVETIKNARKEIAEIAQQLHILSGTLHTLWDIMRTQPSLCRPVLFHNTEVILNQYRQVEKELRNLIDGPKNIARLTWYIVKPKVKALLKKVEAIKASLTLELIVVQLAREEFRRPAAQKDASGQAILEPNRFRTLVESAVQANRQVVESAQRDSTGKSTLTADAQLDDEGTNTLTAEVDVYREGSFDTATWLYHLVFSSQTPDLPAKYTRRNTDSLQPSVVDESTENAVRLARSPFQEHPPLPLPPSLDAGVSHMSNKSMIVWGMQTEPGHVVDRLLADWTTLSQEQIDLSSTRQSGDDWHEKFLKTVEEAKDEQEAADFEEWDRDDGRHKRGGTARQVRKDSPPSYSGHSPTYHWDGSVHSDYTDDNSTPVVQQPDISTTTYTSSQKQKEKEKESSDFDFDFDAFKRASDAAPLVEENPLESDDWGFSSNREGSKKKKESKKSEDTKQKRNTVRIAPVPAHKEQRRSARARNPFTAPSSAPSRPSSDEWTHQKPSRYNSPHAMSDPLSSGFAYPGPYQQQPGRFADYPDPFRSQGSYYPSYAQPSRNPFNAANFPTRATPQDSLPSWPFSASTGVTTAPSPPPAPAHAPSLKRNQDQAQATSTKSTSKEDDVLAAISAIIESADKQKKLDAEDPRFARILQLLVVQQEQQAQADLDRAKAIAEIEMKQILAARDRDDTRIQQLEQLIIRQREEQQRSDENWRAERAALDKEIAKNAREAKEVTVREMAAAQAAKKAARKSLKFAKAEAEKRAKEEAEIKAKEEKQILDKKLKERIQKYEKLLDVAVDGRTTTYPNSERPLRRTCIVDGNRSMEVAEYTTDVSGSHASTNVLTSAFLRQATIGVWADRRTDNSRPRIGQHQHSKSYNSVASMQTSRLSSGGLSSAVSEPQGQSQQLILLPTKVDESSVKIAELHSSLAKVGVVARLEDVEFDNFDPSSQLNGSDDAMVRSSLFWEAPSLSMGSELLSTYRMCGWTPPYARTSAAGHTYFLGHQPIHTFFFRPDYKPQFSSCELSIQTESIVIDQALIHEYALRELGHDFKCTEAGSYVLDGRLQYSDIEALIERSFQMKENYLRSTYRRLDWQCKPAHETSEAKVNEASLVPTVPWSPVSIAESHTSCGASESGSEVDDHGAEYREGEGTAEDDSQGVSEDDAEESQEDNLGDEPESDDDSVDIGLEPESASQVSRARSNVSTSLTSWSSNSNNPFRKRAEILKESGNDDASSRNFARSIWDEPVNLLD